MCHVKQGNDDLRTTLNCNLFYIRLHDATVDSHELHTIDEYDLLAPLLRHES